MSTIHSDFAADEDWRDLLEQLIADIPARIEALNQAMASEDLNALAVLVHQLKGACGSYGFHELTPVALAVEDALHRSQDQALIRKRLLTFEDALSRMTAHAPGH